MTAPLNFFKVSVLLLTTVALAACHSDGSSDAPPPDINTFNIYTSDQTIYSFNEETGISTRRGEFDSGTNQFVELNTDENKQGYEYAAYVYENSIYLLNYDKATNARTIELSELFSSQVVCGIFPHKTASQASYQDRGDSNRSTLDLPVITIEYKKANNDCGSEFNTRDTLDFTSVVEDSENTRDIEKTVGSSEKTLGGLVIDYSSNNNPITASEEDDEKGSSGFLGKKTAKVDANTIVDTLAFNFKVDGDDDKWEKVISPSNGIKVIKQVSNNHVVVQEGQDIYILNTETLFELNSDDSNTPVQDRIDAMFDNEYLSLANDTPLESNASQNTDTFVIKQDNILHFYKSGSFKQIPSNETPQAQSATKKEFDLTSDNTVLVIQEANNIDTLVAITGDTGFSTTILSAEEVEFYISDNEFYVNTLELEQGAGWQAHWFRKSNNSFVKTTYDNSRLIFITNLQEELNSIYLLSSDNEISNKAIVKPSLYAFDKSQANGRKKGRSENSGSVDFSFGSLNTDVEYITSSIIVSDIYGRLIIEGVDDDSGAGRAVEEYYYFNPSQTIPNPDLDEQSLTLIIEK